MERKIYLEVVHVNFIDMTLFFSLLYIDSIENSIEYEDDFFFNGPKINLSLRSSIDQVIE